MLCCIEIDWGWLTSIFGIIGTVIGYICNLRYHRKIDKFNLVLSKFYPALEKFIELAIKYKDNVNSLEYKYLNPKNPAVLDDLLTLPKFELKNAAIILGLFFNSKDRKPFNKLIDAADMLTYHVYYNVTGSDIEIINAYDIAKREFNVSFTNAMTDCLDMMYDKLFNNWQK